MISDRDLSAELEAAVVDITLPPAMLSEVRRAGERRLTRRRRAAIGATALAAGAVAAGVVLFTGADPFDRGTAPAQEPAASITTTGGSPPGVVRVPDLTGMTYRQVERRLADFSSYQGCIGSRASNDVPAGRVLAQDPPPGVPWPKEDYGTARIRCGIEAVVVTYSAGGPAIPIGDLPERAADVLRDGVYPGRWDDAAPGELVLVVRTRGGTAYKTDGTLVGPCAAVDLLYRIRDFHDVTFGHDCY